MTDPRPLIATEYDPRASHRRALAALFALLAFHAWATWGYTGSFYSTAASWMHEVERFAAGEVPYRDFTWPYPPLAMWVIGGAARIVGTQVAALSTITLGVAALMYLAFHRVVAKVAPGVGTSAVVTAFVFASAYAARFSPPLTLGGATPAGPLGMLFLLIALGLIVRLFDRPSPGTAIGVGVSLGLSALSRHDFWIPGLFLFAWGLAAMRHAPDRGRLRAVLAGAYAGTFLAGAVAAMATAGPDALQGLLPHHLREAWIDGFPTVERLVMEIAAASALGIAGVVALWLCFALDDARATRMALALLVAFLSACAVHLGMSVAVARDIAIHGLPPMPTDLEESIARISAGGQSRMHTALFMLDQRFQAHLFPALMPPILLGVLLMRWRRWKLHRDRDLALLMLGLAVAARSRNGFAGADWQNVLIEIPAYALFLHLLAAGAGRSAQRAVSMAFAILFVVGLYTYYNLGVGPLTQQHYQATSTPRGTVRWDPDATADYTVLAGSLDRLDPTHQRPLLAYGPSGAWNYYFARANPVRYTRGFTSPAQVDTVLAELRAGRAPALIVDTRAIVRVTLPAHAALTVWENRPDGGPVTLLDVPRLGEILQGCRQVDGRPGPPPVPLYDCAPATPPDSSR